MGEYDFIMNPTGPQKRKSGRLPSISGGSGSQRSLLLLVGGGGLLVIVLMILYSIFGGVPDNKEQLIKVAQQQHELIRIAEIGVKESRDTQSRNLAMTAKLSLTSDQAPLLAALKKQKVKIGNKQLNGQKNVKTDQMLETAKNNNRFDEEFMEFMQEQLVDYQKNLNVAHKETVNKNLKATLKLQYENASVIIGVDPEE
jgi:hypothetical protein